MAQIDIITPVYIQNEDMVQMTLACFDSIYNVTDQARIIVVDNGSDPDMSGEIHRSMTLDERNFLWFRSEENLGFVKGTNLGLAASTAPYIVFQNNDTIVYDDIYTRMCRACKTEDVGVIGPVSSGGWQNVENLAKNFRAFRALHLGILPPEKVAQTISKAFSGQVRFCDSKTGMVAFFCAMMRREIIERVGYLSEAFGIGLGDDDDYCARIKQAGYRAYLALDCYCHHYHRTTFKELYSNEEITEKQHEAMDILKQRYNWSFVK